MKKIWKQYAKERYQRILGILALWGFLDFYLFFLCDADFYVWDLVYLNLLLGSVAVGVLVCDFFRYRRLQKCLVGEECKEQELEKLMGMQIYRAWKQEEEQQKKELLQQKKYLEDLSDYIARWSHEAKLPLAALKLMNGRNENEELRKEMESSIARLESLMHTVLMGSKLERPEHDVKFERILLEEVIKESIQNQAFFLIRTHFELDIQVKDIWIYSDRRWMVYLLDQLIGNAVKYKKENPKIVFWAEEKERGQVRFGIQDFGIGIPKEELPYVFQKGYVGKNLRKGNYYSTGMGLYFVEKIGKLLHIKISLSSEEGQGCCVTLDFQNLSEYFLTETDR